MSEIQDEEFLWSRITDHSDENAFAKVYDMYWERLYILAYKHLKSSAIAEEVVQDIFLTLWEKRQVLAIKSLSAYMAAMTRFAVYRRIADNKKHLEKAQRAAANSASFVNAEEHIENKLMLEIVEKLSNKLPEKCRLVFIYNKLLDLPIDKVAEQLRISKKTAEAHCTKALKIIRGSFVPAVELLTLLLLLKP